MAASINPDVSSVLAAIQGIQSTFAFRFDGVQQQLAEHSTGIQTAVQAVSAIQRNQNAMEESISDLRDEQINQRSVPHRLP